MLLLFKYRLFKFTNLSSPSIFLIYVCTNVNTSRLTYSSNPSIVLIWVSLIKIEVVVLGSYYFNSSYIVWV